MKPTKEDTSMKATTSFNHVNMASQHSMAANILLQTPPYNGGGGILSKANFF
jgi:hypothetical protein